MNALYVQTNQEKDEKAWHDSTSQEEDQLFLRCVPVFIVVNLTDSQFDNVRAQLEENVGDEDREEKAFAYIQAPFPSVLRQKGSRAQQVRAFRAGGWQLAVRVHMIRSILKLRARLPSHCSQSVGMAIIVDPDTPKDGFFTILNLYNEDELESGLQSPHDTQLGRAIPYGASDWDLFVREGVRVRGTDAWVALSSARINGTMDEAVEPEAQQLYPWKTPMGADEVHQHLT